MQGHGNRPAEVAVACGKRDNEEEGILHKVSLAKIVCRRKLNDFKNMKIFITSKQWNDVEGPMFVVVMSSYVSKTLTIPKPL